MATLLQFGLLGAALVAHPLRSGSSGSLRPPHCVMPHLRRPGQGLEGGIPSPGASAGIPVLLPTPQLSVELGPVPEPPAVAKGLLVHTHPSCLCLHLRMSMKEGVWVTLASAAPRLIRRMKGSTRWLQAESQEPASTGPPPLTQLQLV